MNDYKDEQASFDQLYVGLTRPPMIKGVTDVYAVFMLITEVIIFVGVGGGKGLVYAIGVFPALYLFGYIACLKDPRIFHIWKTKLRYFMRAKRQSHYWNGNSYDPF